MKTYVCDSCNAIIEDPYMARMKEFFYTSEYDFGMAFPVAMKDRKKASLVRKMLWQFKVYC